MMRMELNRGLALVLVWAACLLSGCVHGPTAFKPAAQVTLDRRNVDYPAGFDLKIVASGFTAPVAVAFDGEKPLIAEAGINQEPRIYAIKADYTIQQIYPFSRRIPFSPVQPGYQIYGPIGGMVVENHKIYISHRDRDGFGVITQFGYDGSHKTITSGWPCQGDYGITDLAVWRDPDGRSENDRLFFCVGSATNSGIVGLDNLRWLRTYRSFCDHAAVSMELLGLRSLTKNPFASMFVAGSGDTADTGPFQPFGTSDRTKILVTPTNRPNSVVYSVAMGGGDERRIAYGFRKPSGLVFSEGGTLYFTNQGIEMRGSRPAKDDHDVVVHVYVSGDTFGGFPDYAASMEPLNQQKFQPPLTAFPRNNVPKLGFLTDHTSRDFVEPEPGKDVNLNRTLTTGKIPPLSGAAKLAFIPSKGPFSQKFRGDLIVALSGDTAPFGNGGLPLVHPIGYKVVRVNTDTGDVQDFIYNVGMLPASMVDRRGFVGLERPIDVKIGPDGSLYILDMGEIEYKTDGRQKVSRGTGKLYKLAPLAPATTQP